MDQHSARITVLLKATADKKPSVLDRLLLYRQIRNRWFYTDYFSTISRDNSIGQKDVHIRQAGYSTRK